MQKKRENNTVVMTFARMNPPTKGHQILIDVMSKISKRYSTPPRIYLSHTQDNKKNPLNYKQKSEWVNKSFGDIAHVKTSSAKDIIDVMKDLEIEGIKKVIIVMGSDRVDEFKSLLSKYNGIEYNIDEIFVKSHPKLVRNDNIFSSTQLREHVANDKFDEFCMEIPIRILGNERNILFRQIGDGLYTNHIK